MSVECAILINNHFVYLAYLMKYLAYFTGAAFVAWLIFQVVLYKFFWNYIEKIGFARKIINLLYKIDNLVPVKYIRDDKGQELYYEYRVLKNFFTRSRGLILRVPRPLVFDFKKSQKVRLHMYFVYYPISAYFLDDKKRLFTTKK